MSSVAATRMPSDVDFISQDRGLLTNFALNFDASCRVFGRRRELTLSWRQLASFWTGDPSNADSIHQVAHYERLIVITFCNARDQNDDPEFYFCSRAALQPFFKQKVKKVVVAAPVKDVNPVLNIVFGCNEVQTLTVSIRRILCFSTTQLQYHPNV